MDMTGERRIPAPRQTVWNALNDPAVLRASIPGCESLEKLSDNNMRATAAVKIGPIAARFSGNVLLSEVEPPNSYTITGEGQGGVAGFAKGGAKVNLSEDAGATLLRYVVTAQVGGKIAQLGARLIDASAKQMADAFFDRFSAVVAKPAEVVAPAGAPVFPAGPQTTQDRAGPAAERAFPSAPSAEVAEPVLPPPSPPAAVSVFSLLPREPFGLPMAAWIGGAIYLIIVLVFIGSIL
ncbi:MAG: carbon monoxide dehydrogenase subunit G [Acetobacteraceae bacterium]|nr:carbon monoxide dehydrogenase subunit G [Acetobacteraceae bacterium]